MRGISFSARRGDGPVPLVELLVVLGRHGLDLTWRIGQAEFSPGWEFTARLHEIADNDEEVSSFSLLRLVSDGIQMIEGTVTGVDSRSERPLLIVEAIRGDTWDVYSTEHVRAIFEEQYPDAKTIPGWDRLLPGGDG